jgi:electron transport complex protein RnfG
MTEVAGAPPTPQPPAPIEPEERSSKLLLTLGAGGALAGLLIVIAYQATQPTIQAYKAMKLREAVSEVLGSPDHWDTLYVVDGTLVEEPPAGADEGTLDTIFLGYRQDGSPIGYAIAGAEPGFQDVVELIFGYDPRTKTVLGMKVLTSKETPGLGDRIEKDPSFAAGFVGAVAPLVGVKAGRATGADDEVDMITGATISSRTVIGIINHRLEQLGPILEAYQGAP